METKDVEKMAQARQGFTREWIPAPSSKKRLREDEEEEEEMGDTVEKGAKVERKIHRTDISSSTTVISALQSDNLWLDSSSEHGSDSGIFSLSWAGNQQDGCETRVPTTSPPWSPAPKMRVRRMARCMCVQS